MTGDASSGKKREAMDAFKGRWTGENYVMNISTETREIPQLQSRD